MPLAYNQQMLKLPEKQWNIFEGHLEWFVQVDMLKKNKKKKECKVW